MTLKEKVAEIEPGAIDAECWGGVVDCPCDYEFLIGHYDLNMTCRGPEGSRQDCGICWNSEYIEGYVTDTNVGNKNIRVGTKWRDEEEDITFIITKIDGNNVKYEYDDCIGSMPKEYLLTHCKCIDDTDINVGNISNNVNHPKHYQGKHECIDIMIAMFGKQAVIDFCKCNILKYRWRADKKNGEEDIKKAEWYETKLLELEGE